MTEYIVSARKYRPDTFETLVGQDNIARTLKNSIVRGQLAHAYLFCGPRGVGKTSTARIFAKTINCSSPTPDMEPCGKCESCISFAEGRSYCIHELDAASNNGVDDIKALMEQVRIPPQVGKYSVYIIDEVHMLSQSAFNAFLKTLEEPPAHAIFILATTEKHKILPTILSRCQTYDFNRITVDNIVRNLRRIAEKEEVKIDDESLHVIAQKADGAMRDALTIFDQTVAFCGTDVKYQDVIANLNVLDYEHCFNMVDYFLAGDYASALLKFDAILAKGFNALHFVAALSSHFRDLIVSKNSAASALLELPESLKKRYTAQAAQCSLQFLYECLNITTQCEAGYRLSVNPRLHIEFALMKLSFLSQSLSGRAAIQSAPRQEHPGTVLRQAPDAVKTSSAGSPVTSRQPDAIGNTSGPQPVQDTVSQPSAVPQPVQDTASQPSAAPQPSASSQQAQDTASQPSASSQPQQDIAPASGRTRRRGTRNAPVLSIKSMMNSAEAGGALPGISSGADVETAPPSEEVIRDSWKKLVEVYAAKPRLANTIASAELEFEDAENGRTVVFRVLNDAQKKWIEEKLLKELEGRLRLLTSSSMLYLRVDVVLDSETSAPGPYTPSEKAQDLMSKNDEVRSLISDFGLDVK